ncbi:MAG TPA: hypothetical protein VLC49_03575 [Solirubrobacteraceae bacterium]|nr:hypothetical protein [Solirubrobacteraceae bacterium]
MRLSAGSHAFPKEGACVMELASMLAGEPFSDAPESVCPVIADFLRTYNDHVDDRRRQDLYEFAAKAVGTRSTREVERARGKLCHRWAGRLERTRLCRQTALGPPPHRTPPAILELLGFYRPARAGHWAALTAARDADQRLHRATLRFIDELISVRGSSPDDLPDWFVGAQPAASAQEPGRPATAASAPQG